MRSRRASRSITLDPGVYAADALLIDSAGRARTSTLRLDDLTIHASSELVTPIDFKPIAR
ncbi:MAG TPA: hypothetical protein VHB97_19710 [Polyangia bacterium]|nr:hypothetical protein [Polyangia bacterium]